jgi:hypothetical protein
MFYSFFSALNCRVATCIKMDESRFLRPCLLGKPRRIFRVKMWPVWISRSTPICALGNKHIRIRQSRQRFHNTRYPGNMQQLCRLFPPGSAESGPGEAGSMLFVSYQPFVPRNITSMTRPSQNGGSFRSCARSSRVSSLDIRPPRRYHA